MNLIRAIIGHQWLISSEYVQGIAPFIANLLNSNSDEGFKDFAHASSLGVASSSGTVSRANLNELAPGSIAVVNINGPLMKNDQFCGPVGTATIGSWLKQLDGNPNVDGTILDIDSPGGTVDGTESLADIISSLKKPVVAFVNGTTASAAYWIASASDKIIAGGNTSMIGSIGTMTSVMDMKPVLEKAGVKFHEVNASASTDKNSVFKELLSGTPEGYASYQKNILDPLNEVFLSAVKANRKGKIDLSQENVLTGKVYFAQDALKFGLIDQIGTMADAVNSIRQSKKNTMSKISATQYPNLSASLGWVDGFESNDEGIYMQESDLNVIENALVEATASATRVTELEQSISTLQNSINTLTQANTSLTTQVEELSTGMAHRGTQTEGPQEAIEETTKAVYVDDGSQARMYKYLNRK